LDRNPIIIVWGWQIPKRYTQLFDERLGVRMVVDAALAISTRPLRENVLGAFLPPADRNVWLLVFALVIPGHLFLVYC
jgi:hypothetical protein